MADHRRPVQPLRGDIISQLLGNTRHHRPHHIVAHGFAGETSQLDKMIAVARKRGEDALVRLERLLDDATRALATRGEMTKASDETRAPAQASFASAPEQTPRDRTRGN